MKTVLFQGDSITDCGRSRENDEKLGQGYAFRVAGTLGADRAGDFRFLNRAVSGNRVVDVYARIKSDIINLKPDYMSILIGVNDVWHEFGGQDGISAEKFGVLYDMMIGEILSALPDIKIMILEPFVAHGTAVDEVWDEFYGEVRKRAEKARQVSEKYGLKFVELQSVFDKAYEQFQNPRNWTAEGVHPTPAGHALIAREWLRAFEEM